MQIQLIMLKYAGYIITILGLYGHSVLLSAQNDMTDLRHLVANEAWEEALDMIHGLIKNDMNNPQLWYTGGLAHRNLMRPDSSLIYLQQSASLDPENERTAMALAAAYTRMNRFSLAKELYRKQIERDTVRLDPYIQLASLYRRDNEPSKALEIYRKLNKRDPDNYIYYKNIAMCHRQMRNDPATIRYLRKAHELNREDLSVNTLLAELYMITKNYKEGLEIAERGLEVDRNSLELLFWSGFFNYALGINLQAVVRLEHAKRSGNESLRVLQYLGISYYLTNNFEKARTYLEEAVSSGLRDYRVFNYLGNIYRIMEDFESSEYYFFNSLALLSPSVSNLTSTYVQLIDTYKLSGETDKIAETYRAALIYDEGNPYLHYGLAYTLDTQLQNHALALEHYIKFSEIVTKIQDSDEDFPTLLDHSNARIRRIKEDKFFGGN